MAMDITQPKSSANTSPKIRAANTFRTPTIRRVVANAHESCGKSDVVDVDSIGLASDEGSNEAVFASMGLVAGFRLRIMLYAITPAISNEAGRIINEVIMFFVCKVTKISDKYIVKQMCFTA